MQRIKGCRRRLHYPEKLTLRATHCAPDGTPPPNFTRLIPEASDTNEGRFFWRRRRGWFAHDCILQRPNALGKFVWYAIRQDNED